MTRLWVTVASFDSLNSHKPLNMPSREVTWQIKNIISSLLQCLRSPNLSGWGVTATSSHPKVSITSPWGGLVRTPDKINILYLHLQRTHGQDIMQDADLPWEAPTIKAKWTFDHVTNTSSHVSLENPYLHYRIRLVVS